MSWEYPDIDRRAIYQTAKAICDAAGKGSDPGIRDVQRYLPIGASHLGSMGGGGTQ